VRKLSNVMMHFTIDFKQVTMVKNASI